jgi:hypothetical protein
MGGVTSSISLIAGSNVCKLSQSNTTVSGPQACANSNISASNFTTSNGKAMRMLGDHCMSKEGFIALDLCR